MNQSNPLEGGPVGMRIWPFSKKEKRPYLFEVGQLVQPPQYLFGHFHAKQPSKVKSRWRGTDFNYYKLENGNTYRENQLETA